MFQVLFKTDVCFSLHISKQLTIILKKNRNFIEIYLYLYKVSGKIKKIRTSSKINIIYYGDYPHLAYEDDPQLPLFQDYQG